MYVGVSEWVNEWVEWSNECVIKCVSEWLRVSERAIEHIHFGNEWVSEPEWVNDGVIEWVSEWVSKCEWVSKWVSQFYIEQLGQGDSIWSPLFRVSSDTWEADTQISLHWNKNVGK